jgi:uncharacterized protein (DUF2461 family)
MLDPHTMHGAFHGFSPEVFEWFAGLERDNSKAYFTATRDCYESEVRGGLEAMLDELSESFGGEVKLFRQQRDLRFAPDKSAPYERAGLRVVESQPTRVLMRCHSSMQARGRRL